MSMTTETVDNHKPEWVRIKEEYEKETYGVSLEGLKQVQDVEYRLGDVDSSRYDEYMALLDDKKDDFQVTPEDLEKYLSFRRKCATVVLRINELSLSMSAQEIVNRLEVCYKDKMGAWGKKRNDIENFYENKLANERARLSDEAKQHNKEKKSEFEAANKIYVDLEDKRKILEEYADDVAKLCADNGILMSDVDIDNSSFTVEELSDIYDSYIEYVSNRKAMANPIKYFREKFPSYQFQGCILLVSLILLISPLATLAAFAFFAFMFIGQKKNQEHIKSYIVLYGLIYNIRPLEMGFKGEIDESELEVEDISEDDSRLDDVTDAWLKELDATEVDSPLEAYNQEKAELVSNLSAIEKEYEEKIKHIEQIKTSLLQNVNEKQLKAKEQYEFLKSKIKTLGSSWTTNPVYNTALRLGMNKDTALEEIVDPGVKNIIIRPSRDAKQMKQFLQVLLANALTNVRYGSMVTYVVDPNGRAEDVMSFYDTDIKDILKINEVKLEDILKELNDFMDNNMKEMHGRKIQEFNEMSVKQDSTPREYRLLIVLSQPKEFESKEEMNKLLERSADYGVFIWVVSPDLRAPNTMVFNKPFEGVEHPIEVDDFDFGRQVAATLKQAAEKTKSKGITWSYFMERALTDEKDLWKHNADSEVELLPGFYEGDPNKPDPYTFGNQGNVHIIGVGGTGAGKSVFLNHLICTATYMYSPWELELWMVDFKGAEFQRYIASELNGWKALPHIKACLCTSDGDYATSLYEAIQKESERRYEVFKTVGALNMKEYNKKMVQAGTPEKRMTRILFINDEFQVIFEKADSKKRTLIEKAITYVAKVGRASGIHLFFTSQSMKNTISKDILNQFTLRFVLRCDMDVSEEVLGSQHSGLIKETNGFLYVRYLGMDEGHPKRYRTPFIEVDDPDKDHPNRVNIFKQHIEKMYALGVERGWKRDNVITYNEATKHAIQELADFRTANAERIPDGAIILGPRMTYSDLVSPESVILNTTANKHIFGIFRNYGDFVNFYKTIYANIKMSKGEYDLIINSQVDDLYHICELDKDVPEEMQFLANRGKSVGEVVALINTIYETRKESGSREHPPIYFILLGWDKARGMGIDKDMKISTTFTNLLQVCSEMNVHVIMINTSKAEFNGGFLGAFAYKMIGKTGDENESLLVMGSSLAYNSDMKEGFMYVANQGKVTRAKLYQYAQTREIKKDTLDF